MVALQVNGHVDGHEGHNGFSNLAPTRSEAVRWEESQRRSRRDSIHFAVDGVRCYPLLQLPYLTS